MMNGSTERIIDGLRSWVASASPGARLPSTRTLTTTYGASPVTVQRALRALAATGLVESRPGVGTFVRATRPSGPVDLGWQTSALGTLHSRLPAVAAAQRDVAPGAIALHSGYPARDLLPERLVRGAIARAARTDAAVTRSPAVGLPELRSWFANELAAEAPEHVSPVTARDVLILPGSQSALSSIFRVLVGSGHPLLIESPTYWGAILAAAQSGVTLVPVPAGPDGPDPDDVARAMDRTGARAFYSQPTYANPTGASWTDDTRGKLLRIVRERGAFLIEDDWAHDLAIDTEPHPVAAHDDDGHVIYLRSLTKSVSPSLRVAAVIARGAAYRRIAADLSAETMYVSGLLQAAALDVVTQPGWCTHLRQVRQQLRARRDLLVSGLRDHVPQAHLERPPAGGLYLWVQLPDGIDVDTLTRTCETRGLIVAPGHEWFPAEPPGPFIRLGFAGPDPDRFTEAAQILSDAVTSQ